MCVWKFLFSAWLIDSVVGKSLFGNVTSQNVTSVKTHLPSGVLRDKQHTSHVLYIIMIMWIWRKGGKLKEANLEVKFAHIEEELLGAYLLLLLHGSVHCLVHHQHEVLLTATKCHHRLVVVGHQ
ncbi:hypothetical protein Bbelb_441120 [Branchiostoma belcheri]|nr:hypothetical protein Bbelb_441120 [Branchiostoma belcheri]